MKPARRHAILSAALFLLREELAARETWCGVRCADNGTTRYERQRHRYRLRRRTCALSVRAPISRHNHTHTHTSAWATHAHMRERPLHGVLRLRVRVSLFSYLLFDDHDAIRYFIVTRLGARVRCQARLPLARQSLILLS